MANSAAGMSSGHNRYARISTLLRRSIHMPTSSRRRRGNRWRASPDRAAARATSPPIRTSVFHEGSMSRRRFTANLLLIAGAVLLAPGLSLAQAAEVRLARQFSMGYLQFNVMEHQQLIEKHTRALGLADVKVSWVTFNGPVAVNEALISGNVDIAAGGTPGLLVLWSKTKGTPNEVRGIS